MVSKYLLLAVIFSGLVTWIPRMIPFILVKYKGLPAIVERFLKFLPVSIIVCLDSFKRSDRQGWESSSNQMAGFLSSLSNGLGGLSLPQSSRNGSLWSGFDCRLAFGLLILFENLFKPRQRRLTVYMLLTSSVLSTTSKQCFEQPAASFLVCSLIFIEYKSAIKKTYHRDRYHIMA